MVTQIELEKQEALKAYLKELGSVAIAFSGGVDSTYLLRIAHEVLGDKAIAVTAKSDSFSASERNDAIEFAELLGVRHLVVESHEIDLEGFADNPPNRCYICKKGIFGSLLKLAAENGIEYVADGSNMSDLGDYRPGLQALKEMDIKSPLREVGLYKQEIRNLSKELNLPTWNHPSAACLASRFVFGEKITKEKLNKVEAAEAALAAKGFTQLRVRMHGEDLARIEVAPEELTRLVEVREEVVAELKEIGYTYVTMDLKGYRTGSMNEVLSEDTIASVKEQ